MKKIVSQIAVLVIIIATSGYASSVSKGQRTEAHVITELYKNQTINLFVTHGHGSTPFAGKVEGLQVIIPERDDAGNPIENMKISFEVDPSSFVVCSGNESTARIKTPGLFISENNEKISFRSTKVFTMGMDWYQVNGKMSIKGIESEVMLFVTGIRDANDTMSTTLVLEGQLNLFDWGIDYDKIVNSDTGSVPTKWMHINMKIEMS